jgi:hypothetical protein
MTRTTDRITGSAPDYPIRSGDPGARQSRVQTGSDRITPLRVIRDPVHPMSNQGSERQKEQW